MRRAVRPPSKERRRNPLSVMSLTSKRRFRSPTRDAASVAASSSATIAWLRPPRCFHFPSCFPRSSSAASAAFDAARESCSPPHHARQATPARASCAQSLQRCAPWPHGTLASSISFAGGGVFANCCDFLLGLAELLLLASSSPAAHSRRDSPVGRGPRRDRAHPREAAAAAQC